MNQSQKFMLNTGVIMLGYAYALCEYPMASMLCGIFAMFTAIFAHSENRFFKNIKTILITAIIEAIVIRLAGLDHEVPVLGPLCFFNAVYAVLWSESSFKALRETMSLLTTSLLIFLAMALCLPEGTSEFMFHTVHNSHITLVLLAVIYGPVMTFYLRKVLVSDRCRKYFRRLAHRLIIKPMQKREYDRLAG